MRCARCARSAPRLPAPPYGLPTSRRFAAERSGALGPAWLRQLPALRPLARNAAYLPPRDALWAAPPHAALEAIAARLPYHDVLRYIAAHSYDFLFDALLSARDAPLPHVVYEDLMKCRSFASLQRAPESQFALPPAVLRRLLCAAGRECIKDAHYFGTAERLSRRVLQQQPSGAAPLSAFVFCCAAAGRVDEALAHARRMAAHGVAFDADVFALMQCPALDPLGAGGNIIIINSAVPAKGPLMLRRLCARLSGAAGADAVAAHAMFVHYALTLRHAHKWEVLRAAAEQRVVLAERTRALALAVFASERGVRCGPSAAKGLVAQLCAAGAAADLLFVLLRARANERTAALVAGAAALEFSAAEADAVLRAVESRCDSAFAAALPMIRALLRGDGPARGEINTSSGEVDAVLRDVDRIERAARHRSSPRIREERTAYGEYNAHSERHRGAVGNENTAIAAERLRTAWADPRFAP